MGARDLTALIGSRICHDLISPIGAISNGVELLSLTGHPAGPELEMIADSVGHANARVRFFRLAFGAAPDGARIGRAEVEGILADVSKSGRVTLRWTSPAEVPRTEAKLALLLALSAETAMTRGGTIEIACDGSDWTLLAEGARLRDLPHLWPLIRDPAADAEIDAAEVHFLLAGEAAAHARRPVTVERDAAQIRMRF